MWIDEEIISIATDVLAAAEESLRAEQAVYGLDALTELQLHPTLARAYQAAGFGVLREQPYPGIVRRRFQQHDRCDLVLLPERADALAMPVEESRRRARRARAEQPALWSEPAEPEKTDGAAAPRGVDPADAYWLEFKTLGQFTFTHGVPGPNPAYASGLRTALDDLSKLAADATLRRGGLLVVLFTADEATATHDLRVLAERALARDIPMSSPLVRTITIQERIGNATCALALFPARCTKWIEG